MRKQSFLSLSLIIMLFFSACTKEDQSNNYTPAPIQNNSQAPFVVTYSNWTTDASLNWSDGNTTEPSREFALAVRELTQEQLDAGNFVLVYAKSDVYGTIQVLPAEFSNEETGETHIYSADYQAGAISLSHTKSVNGTPEMPADANEIRFRYIVVSPGTPDPNGRAMTINELVNKPYQELVTLLGIPE